MNRTNGVRLFLAHPNNRVFEVFHMTPSNSIREGTHYVSHKTLSPKCISPLGLLMQPRVMLHRVCHKLPAKLDAPEEFSADILCRLPFFDAHCTGLRKLEGS